MEELIVGLLKDNGRVIIPDFGAFIVKTKSPLKVIFNEFLQYNDGALIGATSKKLGVEREEAAKKVKDYSAKLISELDKGVVIALPEIGNLSKSSTGKITLGDADAETPATPETEVKDEKAATSVEFDVSETQPKSEPAPKAKETPKTSVPPIPPKIEKKPEIKKEEPVAPKPEPVKQEAEKEPTPIAEYYEEEPTRNKLNFVLWAILIVLVNGAIIGYFIFDEEIKSLFSKDKSPEIETIIDTPSITEEEVPIIDESTTAVVEEPIIEEDPIDDIPEPTSPSAEISGKKYYVVAGVFKEESNADKLVITLTQKGYNAEKFGKIGALHAVSFDVFPTKKEADQFMMKMKKEVDAETWIKIVD